MLVACNKEGIGSRMKCLIGAMHLAGDEARIWWPNSRWARCDWGDLFENKIEVKEKPSDPALFHVSWRFALTQEDRQEFQRRLDYMFQDTPERIKKEFSGHISKLKPIRDLRAIIHQERERISPATLGVCCRTWKDTRARQCHFKQVFNAVDKLLKDDIYLTSDSETALDSFIHRYGEKRIKYYKKRTAWGDWTNTTGMQDTLVEMCVPGVARHMVVSWHSAYTECQWWFGGAQANVIEVSPWR